MPAELEAAAAKFEEMANVPEQFAKLLRGAAASGAQVDVQGGFSVLMTMTKQAIAAVEEMQTLIQQ